jgi:HEAT repeat protein
MTLDELVSLYQSPDSVPAQPALNGLDKVDWSAVHDAYGPATSVPALIRALTSCEPIHRACATQALCEHIWHQGTVYSATAAAVPILFDLLESECTPDRPAVAVLLAAIADGEPPFKRCEEDAQEAQKWREILNRCNRSLDAEMEEGRRYGSAIRERISAGLDSLYPYLRDPDPEVRRYVAIAIGQFPAVVDRVLPDLKAALEDEPEASVREEIRKIIQRRTKR